ncbi:hypothetical protein [Paenibacillus tyrfis]|uniref:hypothetical protein n=1 Tax=Paenibacillus tyrfis TaxID=1501230 RepID=UPI00209E64C6|nr:hypothetical protein [Paenibacillus tyrfis]MCP1307528.1 hypothetical protein [Paenibacillus tyrfis]
MKGKVAIVASALLVAMTGSALAGNDTARFPVNGKQILGTLSYDGTTAYATVESVDGSKIDRLSVDAAIKYANGQPVKPSKPRSANNTDYVTTDLTAPGGDHAYGWFGATHKGKTDSSQIKVYQ